MDVFGNEIDIGDEVVYAKDRNTLVVGEVTKITEGVPSHYEVKITGGFWPEGGVVTSDGDSLVVNLEKKYKEKALLYHSEGV